MHGACQENFLIFSEEICTPRQGACGRHLLFISGCGIMCLQKISANEFDLKRVERCANNLLFCFVTNLFLVFGGSVKCRGPCSVTAKTRIAAFFAPAFYFAAHCHAPRSDFCRRRIFYAKENAHASNKKPYNLS